ncbi:uncharacterized protein LOC121936385 [Sceloporus undulatus]|uniref:uncharacterized protein LOC121936385 n=1 Tax=Sceloporus undulatus TaxID=8520 RepID=UPI001C4C6F60|nr:uncharacterized protein LOC121936385 [Sceloporus undulatus]XP_042334534.1 uncharacterized protein LOC121936385 [Sceloporus undulatus]
MASLKTPSGSPLLNTPDSFRDSFADLVGQLHGIDPNRLSFSPFLDLDTQISLAPVSDSPESSVEELRSTDEEEEVEEEEGPLTPTPPAAEDSPKCQWCQPPSLPEPSGPLEAKDGPPALRDESCCDSVALQMPQETSFLAGDQTGPQNPLPTTVGRGSQTGLTRERDPWLSPAVPEAGSIDPDSCHGSGDPGPQHRGGRCSGDHMKAVASAFVGFLFAPWVLYGLQASLPLEDPKCPDLASRVAFALRCLLVTGIPILLGMMLRAFSILCLDPLGPLDGRSRPALLHQLFVGGSVEQFAIFSLNAVVTATYLPQEHLCLVPILAGLFLVGRFCYWACLHLSSTYRGFGFGLSFFPTLALTAYNLFCLHQLGLGFLFMPSPDTVSVCSTPVPTLGLTVPKR